MEPTFLFLLGSCYLDVPLRFSLFLFFNATDLLKQLLPIYNCGYNQKQRDIEIIVASFVY